MKWNKEEFISAVKESTSGLQVIKKLGLKSHGGNYRTIYKYIEDFNLDTTHWTIFGPNGLQKKIPLKDILVENSSYSNRSELKKRLIKKGFLDYKCYECGIINWRGRRLSLHLDHINGMCNDNRLENLRLLCPNCHSLTETYSKGSKGRKIYNKGVLQNRCLDCKKQINRHARRCKKCAGHNCATTKIDWPPVEQLIEMVKKSSFSAVGRELGVSDNAIRKRIKNHG